MAPRNLEVGAELPTLTRATGLANWNRYAAVNSEFVPIHMDDAAGKEAGMGGAFGMGNLQWSYLHALVRQWMGDDGRLVNISCQFRSPNVKGQTVEAHGKITAVREENGEKLVDLEIVTIANGDTTLAPGNATVAFKA